MRSSFLHVAVALAGLVALVLAAGCSPAKTAGSDKSAPSLLADGGYGGRVFDRFYKVRGARDFSPDSKKTPGKADGSGGPSKDGTARDGKGIVLTNDAGHAFRLKSYFGWDLKGTEGIYGADYKNKSYARAHNLLKDTRSAAQLKAWLKKGDDALPAYGDLMSDAQLDAAVGFIAAMRDGTIPRSDDIWSLSKGAGNYVLVEGGDAATGVKHYAQRCAKCHGDKGDRFKLHRKYSLGSLMRAKAYEGWFKVLAGHPGSKMKGQVPGGLSRKDASKFILDILAALCDRTRFPPASPDADVPDGDPRCAAYLK